VHVSESEPHDRRRRLMQPLWVLLALILLIETWLWEHLAPLVRWVFDRIVWRELKAAVATWIAGLPPYPTLFVFLLPLALLVPMKVLALWMIAHGFWLGALAVLGLAKLISVGLTAFIFDATRPKLMQLPWFRVLHDRMLVWITWAHVLVDPIKIALSGRLNDSLRPLVRALLNRTRSFLNRWARLNHGGRR
jgi:hypothetical protein